METNLRELAEADIAFAAREAARDAAAKRRLADALDKDMQDFIESVRLIRRVLAGGGGK